MRSKFTGSAKPGNPAVDRCGAAGSEQRTPDPRAMAGLRSQALRPAARSWLTGVAGPRSRKRGPHVARTPPWSAGRRVPPLRNGGTGRSQDVPRACFADRPPGASQAPAPAGAPLPSLGDGNCNSQRGPARGRPKNTGDESRPSSFRGTRRKRVHARLRGTRANPESIRRSIRSRMSAVPNASTAAHGFRVRPSARASRNDDGGCRLNSVRAP